MASLILTLIGQDRPGLVSRLSEQVAGHGGSWLESRMAHLAGQFAGIVLVSIGDDRAAALVRSLERLRADGLQIQSKYAEIVSIDPSSASLMLSDDFVLRGWDRLLTNLRLK